MRVIHTEGDLDTLLTLVLDEGRTLLDAEASSLFLYDPDRDDLYFAVVVGGDEDLRTRRVPLGQGIVGLAASRRETVVVNDAQTDERHLVLGHAGFVTDNLVAAPMLRGERLIGVLEVLNKRGGPFDDMDARILDILAEQAAAAIETTRLISARIEAERQAALGRTTAGLAHYINNVLGQWKGSSDLMDMGLARQNPDMVAAAWPILKRAGNKITRLVQDMLAVSKAREAERSAVDLNKLVSEVAHAERTRAATLDVTVTYALDDAVPIAMFDARQLHEVVTNLLGNALDAIELHRERGGNVRLTTRHADGAILITVADDGPGIPAHHLQHVFEPFWSTKGSRGTGLGLALAVKAIEEHGGAITVESDPDRGTTFTVSLPYVAP